MENGEMADVVAKDLPILENLLTELSTESESLTEFVENLIGRVDDNDLATEGGVSLLDVKYHSLLSYVIDIILLTRMKVQGKSIANCRAIHRLVENRTVLEKLNPLEHKIKYQIDKLLQQSTESDQNDPLKFKPNIDDLENKFEDSEEEGSDTENTPKKYVPPRIASSQYDIEDGVEERDLRRARERALKKSSIIMDLAQETSDAPIEISEFSSGRKKVQKERTERTNYEETNLTRINLTKKQKNTEKRLMQQSELDTITKFGDIGVLEGNFSQNKTRKRKSGGKYKTGKKWKRLKK